MTTPSPIADFCLSDETWQDYCTSCEDTLTWPLPGCGETGHRLEQLCAVARKDVVLGRLVEAHADALAILAELQGPAPMPGQRWGVWAAGPPRSLTATELAGTWLLNGTKRWCSAAGLATHALVDASTAVGQLLFAVELGQAGVTLERPDWAAAGMARADTRSVTFSGVAAVPVGGPGEYLSRRGFWAGAIGVAACWHGGAVSVADRLLEAAGALDDPHVRVHLGAVHAALWSSRTVLANAAAAIDGDPCSDLFVTAVSARTVVERDSQEILTRVSRALGPGPLAHDGEHAAAVFDLMVYLRQHHAERDLEELGRWVGVDKCWQPW